MRVPTHCAVWRDMAVSLAVLGVGLAASACARSGLNDDRDDGGAGPPADGGSGPIGPSGSVAGAAGGGGNGGGNGGGGGSLQSACSVDVSMRIPSAPLRRLDEAEYANTLRDSLGLRVAPASLPAGGDGFDLDAGSLDLLTDAHHTVAHDFALAATKDEAAVAATTQCDASAMGEAVCAQTFISSFVPRLFRRPLESDEAADFAEVFAGGREVGGDYASGVRAVIEVALQSPELLYLVEIGEPIDSARPALGRPRAYEMASRLSYLLWGSSPDEELLQAAAADRLQTAAQIEFQARRLLLDQRAHERATRFYAGLFGVADLTDRLGLGTDLAGLASEETARFVDHVIWNEGGDLQTLLGAPFTFVNQRLAELYGIAGITGSDFRRVDLPPGQRKGILTQASVLASTASDATDPTSRGAVIEEQLLCGEVPPPPPEAHALVAPLAPQPGETRRQSIERLTASPACLSCHGPIDHLGFGFEHYDSRGAYRESEGALPIDARGTLTGVDTAGDFVDAIGLVDRLAKSQDVERCHARKWMQAAYGPDMDACSREQLERAFTATGGNIRELLVTLTQTDAFLYRPAP